MITSAHLRVIANKSLSFLVKNTILNYHVWVKFRVLEFTTEAIINGHFIIIDVLAMTVDEALAFFQGLKKVTNKLQVLSDVGLGYVSLGQPSSMLSGGEAQRVKLATYIDSETTSKTLFIFDEPTTGLHLDDISKLLNCFRKLVYRGHSVVIIEHNLHVIASADYVIDLGPEAGEKGGHLVACGTPETVAKSKKSLTGKALNDFLRMNES